MNNLEKALEEMTAVFKIVVKNYHNDFKYDQEELEGFKGQFIWCARENGTHLFTVDRSGENLKRLNSDLTEKYLFGHKRPRQILLDTVDNWSCCTVKNAEDMFFFDGKKLKKVSPEQGKQLFIDAARSCLNAARSLEIA